MGTTNNDFPGLKIATEVGENGEETNLVYPPTLMLNGSIDGVNYELHGHEPTEVVSRLKTLIEEVRKLSLGSTKAPDQSDETIKAIADAIKCGVEAIAESPPVDPIPGSYGINAPDGYCKPVVSPVAVERDADDNEILIVKHPSDQSGVPPYYDGKLDNAIRDHRLAHEKK